MAFARWSEESDVYVYLDVGGYFNCCGCALVVGYWPETRFTTTEALLEHLAEHRSAGHLVPERCDERLRAEQEKNDAWIADYDPAKHG